MQDSYLLECLSTLWYFYLNLSKTSGYFFHHFYMNTTTTNEVDNSAS